MQMQSQTRRAGGGIVTDMSHADLASHLGLVGAKGGLWVQFFYAQVRIRTKDAAKNGRVEARLCVAKQPKGDPSTIAVGFVSEEEAAQRWPREFAMFKQYEEVPTDGTSLAEVPGLSQAQIGLLMIHGLRSAEDLVELSRDIVGQIGLDAVRAQKIAAAWLARNEAARDIIDAAEIEAKLGVQIEDMARRLTAMEAQNLRLQAERDALARGAGRPAPSGEPAAGETGENLPYDFREMDDSAVTDGPGLAIGNEDLANPLADD